MTRHKNNKRLLKSYKNLIIDPDKDCNDVSSALGSMGYSRAGSAARELRYEIYRDYRGLLWCPRAVTEENGVICAVRVARFVGELVV